MIYSFNAVRCCVGLQCYPIGSKLLYSAKYIELVLIDLLPSCIIKPLIYPYKVY